MNTVQIALDIAGAKRDEGKVIPADGLRQGRLTRLTTAHIAGSVALIQRHVGCLRMASNPLNAELEQAVDVAAKDALLRAPP